MSEYTTTLGFGERYMPYYGKNKEGVQEGTLYPGHHGIDLVPTDAPADRYPVRVSGVLIGYMGTTGQSSGPHVHVDKSTSGSTAYSHYRDPSDWQTIEGTVIDSRPAGTAGNMVKIKANNGHIYRFLHFDELVAKIGDEVKNMDKITKAQEQVLSIMQTGSKPGRNYDYRFTGLPLTQANLDAMINFWKRQKRQDSSGLIQKIKDLISRG